MSQSPSEIISIVIPCRNEEKYIRRCLQSVLAFQRSAGVDWELLVVDGRSTDRTKEIVSEIAALEPRVRLVDNPRFIQSCALNLGIQMAQGRWILRLDAHSVYPPDYLRLCHETALATGAANVGGRWVTEPGGAGYGAQVVQAITTHKFGVGDSPFRTGRGEGPVDTVPFGFFPRALFDEIGYFDERLVRMQDYEFNRRIILSGRVVWLNPAIVCHYFNQPTFLAFLRKQVLHEAPFSPYLWYVAPYAFKLRHSVTMFFSLGLLGGIGLATFSRWFLFTYLAVLILYALLAVGAALQQSFRYRQMRHAITLPAAFFLYHFIHGLGIWSGLIHLMLGIAPVQKQVKPWQGAQHRRWSRRFDARPLSRPTRS